MKNAPKLARHSPNPGKVERDSWFPLRFRLSKEANVSLLTCVMCMATVLAAGCSTTLDGVFPDGRRLAEAPVEWAGVTIQRGEKRIASEKYLPLEKGDLIQTDSRTYALIRFASGTEAYLAPNSRARIGSLDEFFGEVLAKVRGAFEVKTQYITAAAKGTVFLVRSTGEGVAEVIALEGVISLSSTAGRWPSIDLRAGEKATVVRDQAPTQISASKAELEEIEHRYEPIEKAAPISKGTAVGTGIAIGAVVGTVIYTVTKDSHHGGNGGSGSGRGTAVPLNSSPTGTTDAPIAVP